jgi:hypothetical protein
VQRGLVYELGKKFEDELVFLKPFGRNRSPS